MDYTGYITVPEFCKRLGGAIYIDTLYRLIKQGDLPHVKLGGRILIPQDALDRMMEEQAVGEHLDRLDDIMGGVT